jgi:hypothetical protein
MKIQDIKYRNEIKNYLLTINDYKVCEVGTRTGDFFDTLFCDNCSLGIMVDIWRDTDNPYQNDLNYTQDLLDEQYLHVFKKFFNQNNVKIVREFSDKASLFFPDDFFDLVYLDADHSAFGCYQDLVHWYPKVKPGGVLSGHDYITSEKASSYKNAGWYSKPLCEYNLTFGVIDAVKFFLKENKIDLDNFYTTQDNEDFASYFIIKNGK